MPNTIKTVWALGECIQGKSELRKVTESLSGEYAVIIQKWQKSRSLRQNNWYWLVMTIIGNELGYTKEEVHEEMIRMFAPRIEITEIDTGEIRGVGKRTSAMTKEEMMDYLDSITRFASTEMGITLPQPEV